MSDSLTLRTAACHASLSLTVSQSLLKFIPSYHFILYHQCLQASVSFPMSHLFPSGGQSIGASGLSLVNIQGWFPLGLTGLMSLLSKRLSRIFFTEFERVNSLALRLINGPTLTSIHDNWKNHSFDYMHLCWQSYVFAFEYTV